MEGMSTPKLSIMLGTHEQTGRLAAARDFRYVDEWRSLVRCSLDEPCRL